MFDKKLSNGAIGINGHPNLVIEVLQFIYVQLDNNKCDISVKNIR